MSRLVVDELITTLDQPITVDRSIYVATIRPHLYCHNSPIGTFSFNIYSPSGLIKSFSFTSLDIKSACGLSEAYFHAYYSIPMTPFLVPRGNYTIKLESSGYTFSESSFMGWCKDVKPTGRVNGDPENYTENPFSFNLIEYQPREF